MYFVIKNSAQQYWTGDSWSTRQMEAAQYSREQKEIIGVGAVVSLLGTGARFVKVTARTQPTTPQPTI